MIDSSVLARLRAYVCCEPDSRPPTHADLGALLAEVDRAAKIAEERDAARRELVAIDNAICASGHPPGDGYNPLRLAREVLAKVAPAPTIGGPMPEPWPGMGVERIANDGDSVIRYTADPIKMDGVWFMTPTGNPNLPDPDDGTTRYDELTAIYEGRRCIWRRA